MDFLYLKAYFNIWGDLMEKPNCNKYIGAKVPPCAELLGNFNPVIKDGKLIFRNLNRLFYFIGISPKNENAPQILSNIQISLPTYITGLFINQIECNKINYNEADKIHGDEKINTFIHNCIKNPTNINFDYLTQLKLVYSNVDAILPPFEYTINISLNNYLTLLSINRIEGNPLLFFINNSDATEDIFNFILAEIDLSFPLK